MADPQQHYVEFQIGNRKYSMPWNESRDPTDDELEAFASKSFKAPSSYGEATGGKTRGLSESVLPEYDKNKEQSFPVRAAKEIGYEGLLRPALSPAGIASNVLGPLAPGIGDALSSTFPKAAAFLNKPIFGSSAASEAAPAVERAATQAPEAVKDISGRVVAPAQGNSVPVRPVGPHLTNTPAQSTSAAPPTVPKIRAKLPADLRSATPRLNLGQKSYIPVFDSDLDKAAYIVAKNTPSKRDADYLKFVMDTLDVDESGARNYGLQVRGHIKDVLKTAPEGYVKIPEYSPVKSNVSVPASGPISKVNLANAESLQTKLQTGANVEPNFQNVSKVKLKNPNQQTVQGMMDKGFIPDTTNPDGSINFVRQHPLASAAEQNVRINPQTGQVIGGDSAQSVSSVNDISGGAPPQPPLTPPPTGGIPSFPPEGGGNVPPTPPSVGRNGGEDNIFWKALSASKSMMSGIDMSAPLRQGGFLVSRPQFWKSWGPMIRSFGSERNYQGLMSSITSDPDFELARAAGINFTDLGPEFSSREEAIPSDLPTKIPYLGHAYRASNRAYSGFLNKLRFDTFKTLAPGAREDELGVLADYINTATGRGKLKGDILGKKYNLEPAAKALNNLFFSPRFMASRIRLLNPYTYGKLAITNPYVAKQAVRDAVGLTSSLVAVLGLAKATGAADVEVDPRSADFGKLKFGDTRVDLTAGFGPYVRLIAQNMMGAKKSSITGKITKLNTGKYGAPTRLDTVTDFMQNKEAPIPSFITDMLRGTNAAGKDFSVTNLNPFENAVVQRYLPMISQDIYEVLQHDPKYAPAAIPGFFGASVQSYGKKDYGKKKSAMSLPRTVPR